MINKIKKYYKEILIVIFVIFSMNKCAQSCNRAQKINTLENKVLSLDSVIDIQQKVIDMLERDTADYINQIRMYKTFELKRDKADSINSANLAKQKAQTDALIKKLKK